MPQGAGAWGQEPCCVQTPTECILKGYSNVTQRFYTDIVGRIWHKKWTLRALERSDAHRLWQSTFWKGIQMSHKAFTNSDFVGRIWHKKWTLRAPVRSDAHRLWQSTFWKGIQMSHKDFTLILWGGSDTRNEHQEPWCAQMHTDSDRVHFERVFKCHTQILHTVILWGGCDTRNEHYESELKLLTVTGESCATWKPCV